MPKSSFRRLSSGRIDASEFSEDAGFTLIELMVVLLILAILLAIAIPTFLGVTKSANDRAAQSNLNTALINAKSVFQQNSQSYNLTTNTTYTTPAAVMAATLVAAEPNLSFGTGTVSSGSAPAQISVAIAADGNGVILAAQAKGTGNCWYVIDNSITEAATASTPYANLSGVALTPGTAYGEAKGATSCTAATPPATSATVSYLESGFPSL
jgi:type IV pilus assembly protein PilA